MKVAFVNVLNGRLPGVLAKMRAQAKVLSNFSKSSRFYVFYSGDIGDCEDTLGGDGIAYVKLPSFSRGSAVMGLPMYIAHYLKGVDIDVVFLRSIPLSPFFWVAFRNRSYRLIVEYHSKLMPELYANKDYKHLFLSGLSRGLANTVIDGKVSVTGEIARYESCDSKAVVIPNGLNISKYKPKRIKICDGKVLCLAFVASQNHPWQGLDRLLKSLRANELDGGINCQLDIVGRIDERDFVGIDLPKNIKFHGFQSGQSIAKILSNADIGVSTLALYKKNMVEACALKSREYLMNSIPFIYGYNDPDILPSDKFAMKVGNDESRLDMSQIYNFAMGIAQDAARVEDQMKDAVMGRFSWEVKIAKYIAFALEVYSQEAKVV